MAEDSTRQIEPIIELEVDMPDGVSESNAEAWAVGERKGDPVDSGDATYQNNAKYYAEKAKEHRDATSGAEQATARHVAEANEAATAARGAVDDAEAAADDARGAAKEAAETVAAAQGPGILYIGDDGIPYVID